MKILIALVILVTSKSFACDEFLTSLKCTEKGQHFEHILSRVNNEYILEMKNDIEEKKMIFDGQKYIHYSQWRKSEVSGTVNCSKNQLVINATSTETLLSDPNNVMSSDLLITYKLLDQKNVAFSYHVTSTFIENGSSTKFLRDGEGTCTR